MLDAPRFRVLELTSLLLLAAISFAFYRIMAPFLLDAFLAVVLANVFFGVYRRVRNVFRGRSYPAAGVTVLVVLVVVAVPVTVVGLLVYSEVIRGYETVRAIWPTIGGELEGIGLLEWARDVPFLSDYVTQIEDIRLDQLLLRTLDASRQFILQVTQRSFVNITQAVLNFVLVLFLMFFMFVDGPGLVRRIYEVVPMPDEEMDEIVEETLNTTTATLISTIIIGVLEGAFGATLFIVFRLPSPFLWGVIIMILSMIPLIGTNLVIAPAGLILIVSGRIGPGILLIALGFGGVAITQNVVKPKLLGDRAGLHPALVLLATIGGIAWLGLIGFLVGPLLASLFIVVWEQFGKRYAHVLATKRRESTDEAGGPGDDESDAPAVRGGAGRGDKGGGSATGESESDNAARAAADPSD